MMLPAIKRINIELYHNTGSSTIFVLTDNTQYLPSSNPITTLKLVKHTDTANTGYVAGSDTYIYKYSSTTNWYSNAVNVSIWYENNNTGAPNKLVTTIGPFTSGGRAGIPQSVSLDTNNATTPTIKFRAPALYDVSNNVAPSGQTLYYEIRIVPVSTLRATTTLTGASTTFPNQSLNDILQELYSTTSTDFGTTYIPFTATGLFPSTTYDVYVKASNDNTTFSAETSAYNFTTLPPTLNDTNYAIAFNSATIKAAGNTYYLSGNHATLRSEPLILRTNAAVFNQISNFNIHNTNNRGLTSQNICTLTCTAYNDGVQHGQTIASLDGFNNQNSNITSQDTIEIIVGTETDANTISNLKGYYKQIDITPKIKANVLTADDNQHTFELTTNNTLANNITGSPYAFRVDDISTLSSSITYGTLTIGTKKVSGVTYVNEGQSVSVQITLNDFINYYYRQNPFSVNLLDSGNNIISPSNLDQRSTLNGTTRSMNNINTSYNKTFTYGSSTFSKELKVKTTAYLVDSTLVINGNTNTENRMLDALTIKLVNDTNKLPTTNQVVNSSGQYKYGVRRHIANNQTDIFKYGADATINGTQLYDDTALLTSNLALQISKGFFTTYTANTAAYDNYDGTDSNNSIDYRGIRTGARYAAFSWAGPTSSVGDQFAAGIIIRLNNVEVNGQSVGITNDLLNIGGKSIGVYYRTGNGSSTLSLNNSIWLSATKGGNVTINGNPPPGDFTRYTITSYNKIVGGLSNFKYNSSAKTIEFQVLVDVGINNTNVYAVVEVPMDADFRFDSVSLTATASNLA
jgi:hypothetical protein